MNRMLQSIPASTSRTRRKVMALVASSVVALTCNTALAQTDVRMIRPDVMLLLDTSGSMEWRTGTSACSGIDGGACNRCSNNALICSSTCPASERKNRWTTALEVLTGTIQNFSCVETVRDSDPLAYDFNYPINYHLPRSNGVPLYDPAALQSNDGILDTYSDRVRFGLMSFDNDQRIGTSANNGMFSFGATKYYRASNCLDPATAVNAGARRPSTDAVTDPVPGAMISVGAPTADATAQAQITTDIQRALLGTFRSLPLQPIQPIRPYGGTPIAAMLEDALEYWRTHPDVIDGSATGLGDRYYKCRQRYNILVTDGVPNQDFRPECEGPGGQCPYPRPEESAMRMAFNAPGYPAAKTFVIAFNANDSVARTALEPIALAGGTTSVLYASDRAGLQSAISGVLDRIASQTTTRTAPSFGTAGDGTNGGLYQFQSSFAVNAGLPWEGVLERRRTECVGSPAVPVDQTLDRTKDDFGYLLRADQRTTRGWGTRRLWTWIPSGATTPTQMKASMAWSSGLPTQQALDGSINPALFAVASATERDLLYGWLRGDAGTIRETRPLGDIYHSNPLVVGPSTDALPDQTYTDFRNRRLTGSTIRSSRGLAAPTVGTRETMVYVGTNDGILHAFNADSGEEVWGFVPPYLTDTIRAMYPNSHQSGVDGNPVARDVVLSRSASNPGTADSWRSVLLTGLRGGGGAYVALDVTDPYQPKFMWQFADANMAFAYGTPILAQIYTDWRSGTKEERAVAIIPGGSAPPAATCMTGEGVRNAGNDGRISVQGDGRARTSIRCWQGTTGQYLYVVDVETGGLIAKLGPTGSPLVGSPALHLGTPGSVATRAYVGDADGGIWRLDMSSPSPSQWKFGLAYDMFYDAPKMQGQPAVAQPVISIDRNNDTLIAVGSGDPDLLEGVDANRIAVFREHLVTDSSGQVSSITISKHWELRQNSNVNAGLYPGERLTGSMSLFNGALYFGTFVPSAGSDACEMGFSRLWGVDELKTDGVSLPEPRLDVDGNPNTTADVVRVTRDLNGNNDTADDLNSVLYGVGIVRRPTCTNSSQTTDPFTGAIRQYIDSIQGGDFRLVVQTGTAIAGTTSGARTAVVSRTLATPVTETKVNAWAVVFE